MKKVKVHRGCIGQSNVIWRKNDPPAPKCRCKKEIDWSQANEMVNTGEAKWVVIERHRGTRVADCPSCVSFNDLEKRSCDMCKGGGTVSIPEVWDTWTDKEIVILAEFKAKTPRVATIEEEHIIYAYVDRDEKLSDEAYKRIEAYANMNQESLGMYGAEVRNAVTGDLIIEGKPEPEDKMVAYPPGSITFKDGSKNKSWYWIEQGRRYEYGRAI